MLIQLRSQLVHRTNEMFDWERHAEHTDAHGI